MVQDMRIGLQQALQRRDDPGQRDEALKKACKEFESVLTYELMKSMRRTIDKCDLFHGGREEEIYESFLDQELAKNMAGRGNSSLAQLLYLQLKRDGASDTAKTEGNKIGALMDNVQPRWPMKAAISSRFGWRKDPINGERRFHYGVDIAAREGTLVRASMPGKVLISGRRKGYGNFVLLDHGNGFSTLYAHNQLNLVNKGDWVRGGAPLARVGSTGRSTGPHLHFEIKRHGRHLDPIDFIGNVPGMASTKSSVNGDPDRGLRPVLHKKTT